MNVTVTERAMGSVDSRESTCMVGGARREAGRETQDIVVSGTSMVDSLLPTRGCGTLSNHRKQVASDSGQHGRMTLIVCVLVIGNIIRSWVKIYDLTGKINTSVY